MQNMAFGLLIVLMSNIGLKNGDKIVAVNGEPVKYFDDLPGKFYWENRSLLKETETGNH